MTKTPWNPPNTRPDAPGFYHRIAGVASDSAFWDGSNWFHVGKSRGGVVRVFETPHKQQDRAWRASTPRGANALPEPGTQFGLLTYLHNVGADPKNHRWLCVFKCLCGNEKAMDIYEVRAGTHRSCGCLRNSALRKETQRAKITKWHSENVEAVASKNKELGLSRRGSERAIGPGGKWALNVHSKEWSIIAPSGERIRGWNLSDLIRQNAHLFNEGDLNWVKGMCRASQGIRRMYQITNGRPHCHQWKGWRRGDVIQEQNKEAACQT